MTRESRGWSIIEFSLVSILMLSLLLGLVGVVDHLDKVRLLEEIVDAGLSGVSVLPFQNEPTNFDRGRWNTAELEVRAAVNKMAEGVAAELQTKMLGHVASVEEFVLVATAYRVSVDPKTGRCGDNPDLIYLTRLGALPITNELARDTDNGPQIANFVKPANELGAQCLLASPSPLFGLSQSVDRYGPASALLSISLAIDSSSQFGGRMYHMMGGGQYLTAVKVVPLRGDLADG